MCEPDLTSQIEKWTGVAALLSLLVLVSCIGLLLSEYSLAFAGDSDTSGYVHNSRLLMEGYLFGDVRPIGDLPLHEVNRWVYQPLGFVTSDDLTRQVPTYPFGFPLVLAVFRFLADGDSGVLIAQVFIGCATLLSVFFLSRQLGLSRVWSFLATLVIGVSPLFQFMAIRPMSDLLSAGLATCCVLFARVAHRHFLFAGLLGFCVSLALLTRAPNIFLALPVGLLLLVRLKEQRWWWVIVLGSLPGFWFLLWLNNTLYGSPLASGYADVWRLFRLEYFGMTLRHFAYWLSVLHTPVITIAFVASLVLLRKDWLKTAVLWTWAASFIVFYGFYFHSHQTWWFLRFILPALPPIVIGACLFLQEIFGRLNRRFDRAWLMPSLCLILALYIALSGLRARQGRVHFIEPKHDSYMQLVDWVEEHAEAEDVFVCMQASGCLYYYTDHSIVRYDQLKEGEWERIQRAMGGTGGVIYATLYRHEIERYEALSRQAPGTWAEVASLGHIRVMRLSPHDPPYSEPNGT